MKLNLLNLFQPTNSNKPLGGRYKIISQLGAGGFGQTFLAEDLHLPGHPRCVVKQLKPQVDDEKSLQTARRLFDVEAKVLYQLGNHDQIPRLLAHFEEAQEFYLAQELIEGEPLTKDLSDGRIWLESEVIALLQDLLHVLAFVHEQQVIHRDIKPSNLIRRRHDRRIVLIDFGAVKEASTQVANPKVSHTKTISIGTQGYTPKEQLGGNPRFSSDIYAVGMIGIQALTGVHPRRLSEDPQTGEIVWRDRARHVSPELVAILDRMVRYDFRDRYPTAVEALQAVRSLLTPVSESQVASEPTTEATEEPTAPAPQASLDTASSTHSGTNSSSTQIWQQAPSPVQSPPGASSIGSTPSPSQQELVGIPLSGNQGEQESLSPVTGDWQRGTENSPENSLARAREESIQSQPSVHSSPSSAPTVVTPEVAQKRFVQLWLVLPVFAAGAMVWFAKPVLFPDTGSQSATTRDISTERSSKDSNEESTSPFPGSPAVTSPSKDSNEESTSPSPGSPAVISPSVSSTENSTSPSPSSPSPTTKASPSPATPGAKASPSPATPSTKPSPPPATSAAKPSPASASQPEDAKTKWERCYNLNLQQQYTEAIAACDRALAINPDYPEALWSKGYALDHLKRHQEALALYEKATELKPDFAEAWANRGTSLLVLGRPKDAIAAFDKATALKPDFAVAWRDRGAALMELERYDEAIASLEKALQLVPNDEDAFNLLMMARIRQGN
ncbi:MAG: tetratricopeptide repeat protein [Coleofasciculus sp. S288]|nr:tetratricopeptide repeat protein [Coleofasciculus sp. S288]